MTNLDEEEINKFNSLADKWWDINGDFKPLHQINPLRVEYISTKVNLNGLKVLDVGCGGGILSESLASLGADVTGIDPGDSVIEVAKVHSNKVGSNIRYLNCTIEDLISDDINNKFDVITCLEMLEHVPNPSSTIKAISLLLKDKGRIFLSTINRNPKSYLFAILGAEYILKLLPTGTHDYQKFIKPSELANWLRSSHLALKETKGLSYNPLTDKYWLGHDVSVNYMMYAESSK